MTSRSDQQKTVTQRSAGGVVFKPDDNGYFEILIVVTLPEMNTQIPKGIIDPGETAAQAALREVSEEGGVNCEIVAPLGTIDYHFIADFDGPRTRYHKYVDFFLMRYLSGDVADHDHEVADAIWVSGKEVLERLTFDQEREITALAVAKIKELL